MSKVIQIILLILFLTSCKAALTVNKVDENKLYFPTYNENSVKYHIDEYGQRIITMPPIEPNDSLSLSVNDWYSKYLRSLREPILYDKKDSSINIIRFTHLGTWSNPYSYRMEQTGHEVVMIYSKTDGSGGYDVGKRVEHKTKNTDIDTWNLIVARMDSIDFWGMGTHDENIILDGAEWIFEAFINGKYHFVRRTSPDYYDGKNFAELCNLLVKVYTEQN